MSDFQDYLDKCTFCTDSFMSYAFDGDTELATTLIQVLLNRDDLVALSCEAQTTAVSLNKESTFDILAQDTEGNLYDIEIQNRFICLRRNKEFRLFYKVVSRTLAVLPKVHMN